MPCWVLGTLPCFCSLWQAANPDLLTGELHSAWTWPLLDPDLPDAASLMRFIDWKFPQGNFCVVALGKVLKINRKPQHHNVPCQVCPSHTYLRWQKTPPKVQINAPKLSHSRTEMHTKLDCRIKWNTLGKCIEGAHQRAFKGCLVSSFPLWPPYFYMARQAEQSSKNCKKWETDKERKPIQRSS